MENLISSNKKYFLKLKSLIGILLFFNFLSIVFLPGFVFSIVLIQMFLLSQLKFHGHIYISAIIVLLSFISLIFTINSTELFLYMEHDFTSYYNNYLDFYNKGFILENFIYAGGLEFFVPLINYLFSILLNGPYPDYVFLGHSIIILFLLYYVCYLFSKKYFLNINQFLLLLSLVILLFKYGASMNHLRQTYASLFILIAIFSRVKIFYIFLAVSSHLSSILIYPLTYLIINGFKKEKFYFFMAITLIGLLFFYFNLELIVSFILEKNNLIFEKITFSLLYFFNDNSYNNQLIFNYMINNLVASLYLILLLFILKIFFNKKKIINIHSLYLILFILISLSFLPGLSLRLLEPLLFIGLGFIYYLYLQIYINYTKLYLLGILLSIFFMYKWTLLNELYFNKYPMIGTSYINFYLNPREIGNVDRTSLPKMEDIKNNENKL